MAKILFTSDLHFGVTKREAIDRLVVKMRAEKADALVILGDLGEPNEYFGGVMELLKDVAPRKGYVAGNHDLWCRGTCNSTSLWNRILPEIAVEHGFESLEGEIWRFDGFDLVATMGWYDYSAIDAEFKGMPSEFIASEKGKYDNDATYVNFLAPDTDLTISKKCRDGLEKRLRLSQNESQTKEIIVGTHVPIFEEQMFRKPGNRRWGFSNAYFGDLTTGEMVKKYSKVRCVVSGHTHTGREMEIVSGNRPPIRAVVIDSEYGKPAYWVYRS